MNVILKLLSWIAGIRKAAPMVPNIRISVVSKEFEKAVIEIVARDINEHGVLGQMLRNRK